MIATRIKQRLETDTIRIPNAEAFIGKEVEVIVLTDAPPSATSIEDNPRKRILASAKGKISISPDFDAPLPENVLKEFCP